MQCALVKSFSAASGNESILIARDLLVRELCDSKAYAFSNTDLGEVLFYDAIFWD